MNEALNKLDSCVKADTGVSEIIKSFLICLGSRSEIDLGKLCALDNNNFEACVILFKALKTEERFDMWEQLNFLGYTKL